MKAVKWLTMKFGQSLAAARIAAGLTQAEAAARAGITRPGWARLESGKHTPRLDLALRAAAAVGVPLRQLVDLDAAAPRSAWPATADRYAIAEGCESGRWYLLRLVPPRFFAAVWEDGDDEAALAATCYAAGGYAIVDPVWFDVPPDDVLAVMKDAAKAMRRYDRRAD